jgi:hypothetical protein
MLSVLASSGDRIIPGRRYAVTGSALATARMLEKSLIRPANRLRSLRRVVARTEKLTLLAG